MSQGRLFTWSCNQLHLVFFVKQFDNRKIVVYICQWPSNRQNLRSLRNHPIVMNCFGLHARTAFRTQALIFW
jgi:hypothetical protein